VGQKEVFFASVGGSKTKKKQGTNPAKKKVLVIETRRLKKRGCKRRISSHTGGGQGKTKENERGNCKARNRGHRNSEGGGSKR